MANGYLKTLRENWFLIIALVSLVGGWFTFDARLGALEYSYAQHCQHQEKLEDQLQKWKSVTDKMGQDVLHMGTDIQDIKQTNREILRRLP